MRRIAISGMGCVSGLGQGLAETWSRAVAGDGAIRPIDRAHESGNAAWRMAGAAAAIDTLDSAAIVARFGARALGQLDRLSTLAIVAALEAVDDAGLSGDPVLAERTAIVLGCGSGGNATVEAGFHRLFARGIAKVHPQSIPTSMISAPASQIAMLFGVHGPAFVVASACASSAHAIGEAMHMIRSGRAEVAIAGGAEACLTLGSWVAWQSLGVLAPDTCRPFSADRRGLVLGEGAALLVLEDWDRATARGATIHGELIGYGASSDAAHITAPDQAGVERAIRRAHEDAGVPPDRPVLISSHGTGTVLNDRVEATALAAVYGDALADNLVVATKSAHGHLIGGSGALEFALGMMAIREGVAPPILNHEAADPTCDLPLALEATPIGYDTLVSNSFAFGGLNAVLIGRRA